LSGPPQGFWGDDYGTCSTGVFSERDLDATCQVSRTVEVTGPTTLEIKAHGFPEAYSDSVGGEFDVIVEVTAIKVALPS
jgi:hypothetical protein